MAEAVDLVFAYAVVHELPDARDFFTAAFGVLKQNARLFIAEPGHHVSVEQALTKNCNKPKQQGSRLLSWGAADKGLRPCSERGSKQATL